MCRVPFGRNFVERLCSVRVVRSHVGWGGEQIPLHKGVETLRTSMKGKTQKGQYMLAGLGPLRMVSEPDTGRCASKEVKPQRG